MSRLGLSEDYSLLANSSLTPDKTWVPLFVAPGANFDPRLTRFKEGFLVCFMSNGKCYTLGTGDTEWQFVSGLI